MSVTYLDQLSTESSPLSSDKLLGVRGTGVGSERLFSVGDLAEANLAQATIIATEIANEAAAAAVAGLAETIPTQIAQAISGLSGSGLSAASFGFLPTATGVDNVVALQAAVSASPTSGVIVIPAGVYDMADGVLVPSGCSLRFEPGVIFQKSAAFWSFFVPAGIATRTVTENVTFEGAWTVLKQNGWNSNDGTVKPGQPLQGGMFEINFTKNWTIRGFVFDLSAGIHTFSIHGGANENTLVENIKCIGSSIGGAHDGRTAIQFEGGSKRFTVRNLDAVTNDDTTACTAEGYAGTIVTIGDIEDGLFENIVDRRISASQVGFTNRTISSSWEVWGNGKAYNFSDFANNAGQVYMVAGSMVGYPKTASVAPVHTSGTVTGADGIPWQWMATSTALSMNVRNITVRNVVSYRDIGVICSLMDNNEYARSVYGSTFGNSIVENLTLDNAQWFPTADGGQFVGLYQGNVGKLTVKNCSDVNITGTRNLYGAFKDVYPCRVRDLVFENVNVAHSSDRLIRTPGFSGSSMDSLMFKGCKLVGTVGSSVNSTIFVGITGDVKKYTIRDCDVSNFPNLLAIAGNTTGVVLAIEGSKFTGNIGIAHTAGEGSPFTVFRSNCQIDVDDGSMFSNGYAATSPITMISTESNTSYQGIASGTAYPVYNYETLMTFGTTSPSISLANPGKYRISCRLNLVYSLASFAARPTLTVSYRVDDAVQAQSGVFLLPDMVAETSDTRTLILPDIFVSQVGAAKVINLQAGLSSNYWRGTVTIDQCELTAVPVAP